MEIVTEKHLLWQLLTWEHIYCISSIGIACEGALDRVNDSCVWGYFVIFGMSCPQIVFRSGLFQNNPAFPVKVNYRAVRDFLRPMKFNNTRRHWMNTPRNSRTHWEEWSEIYECWNESVLDWSVAKLCESGIIEINVETQLKIESIPASRPE